jgi:alpha-beta hydrolase superfamily lysophospholipase
MPSSPMITSLDTRELVIFEGKDLGAGVQGTYHRAAQASSGKVQDRPAVLFLNSLSLPRAASGDSAVQWADSIAQSGYPTFRIDMPGLGDSAGHTSTDLLDNINAGKLAPVASAVVKEITQRYALPGVIIFGHCAGSVSALYAAAAVKECKGLILLDPYFHLPQAKRPAVREGLSDWARRSKIGRLLSYVYDRVKKLALLMRGTTPPGNANQPLLACWKQVATGGLPILLLRAPGIKAQGSKPRVGEFDYIEHILKLAGRKSKVSAEFVEGADHSFANHQGREAAERHIGEWLSSHFAPEGLGSRSKEVPAAQVTEIRSASGKSKSTTADLGCVLEGR